MGRRVPNRNWRKIPGLPHYEVSEDGDVRRIVDGVTRKAGFRPKGSIQRYRSYKLTLPNGGKRSFKAHKLVAGAFLGPQPSPLHQIAHGDGNPRNNHFTNLRWATPRENNGDDRRRHEQTQRGTRNGRAVLTEDDVRSIRQEYATAKRYGCLSRLARKYGVQPSTIRNAATCIRWGHVDA
jgi:hypothetical protein